MRVILLVIVAAVMALAMTEHHRETERDLAQLTPAQRLEIVSRWR